MGWIIAILIAVTGYLLVWSYLVARRLDIMHERLDIAAQHREELSSGLDLLRRHLNRTTGSIVEKDPRRDN